MSVHRHRPASIARAALGALIAAAGVGLSGAAAAQDGARDSLHEAGHSIHDGVRATGHAIHSGLRATGHAIHAGVRAVGHGIHRGVRATGHAIHRTVDGNEASQARSASTSAHP